MKRILLAGALLATAFNTNAQIITTIAGNSIGCCSGVDSGSYFGDGGAAIAAGLYWPVSIAFDPGGNMLIADYRNNRIRKVSISGTITTVAGNGYTTGYPYYTGGYSGDGGSATSAQLNNPGSIAVDNAGNIYIADGGTRVRKISTSGVITTIAGTGTGGHTGDGGAATTANITANTICLDASGNLYIAGQFYVRKVNTVGVISTIAGNGMPSYTGDGGLAVTAGIDPSGIDIDGAGNIYIADGANFRIRKINAAGIISTVAGNGVATYTDVGDGGPATAVGICQPSNVKVDAAGNIYITESVNQVIRMVKASGIITTIAGTGGAAGYSGDGGPATSAKLRYPNGVAVRGSNLFIADQDNNVVRRVAFNTTTEVRGAVASMNKLSIAPNPNSGSFRININSDDKETISLVVCNSIGQKIKEINITTNEAASIKLDVPLGIYFITATTGKERYFEKLIVE